MSTASTTAKTSAKTTTSTTATTPASAGERAPFHSLALAVWLLAATLPGFLTSHPVYLGVALLLVSWTYRQIGSRSQSGAAWGSFARFALVFVLFTLAFNVLLGGAGETVLMELPAWQVTSDEGAVMFQVGGAITLESVVFGLIRAAALLLVIFALATFNTLADHSQLLRGLPRWLDQAAIIVSIAIAFMPQLVAAQRDVREALALRGRPVRKLRDFLPLIMVLLSEALERAMNLAESMEARGYSGPPLPPGGRRRPRLLIAGGLLLLGAGTVVGDLRPEAETLARGSLPFWARIADFAPGVAVGVGVVLIVAALFLIGRRARRSRYRRELWRPRDSALALISVVAGGVLLALYQHDRAPFLYPVFPRLTLPDARLQILLPLLALLAPLACLPRAKPWGRRPRPAS